MFFSFRTDRASVTERQIVRPRSTKPDTGPGSTCDPAGAA